MLRFYKLIFYEFSKFDKSTSIPHKLLGHTNEFLLATIKNLDITDAQPIMLRCVIHMT